jgi:hypothetical protein
LTYNATSLKISAAVKAGLVLHAPLRPLPARQRAILVTANVEVKLQGKDEHCGLSSLGMAEVVGRFIGGHVLTVSRKCAKRRNNVDLEQLEELPETWGLCYRRPRPGWRLFGRFLERDVFVGLRLDDRHDIGSNFAKVAHDIKDDWANTFGKVSPLLGARVEDYISGAYYDVDQGKLF